MIKYICTPTPAFLADFESTITSATQERMRIYLSTIPEPDADRYRKYFDSKAINDLLLSSPGNLTHHIHKIYSTFPELADRFWPVYLLSRLPDIGDIDNQEIRSSKGKTALEILATQVEAFLNDDRFKALTLLPKLLEELKTSKTASEKKRVLSKIRKAAKGDLILGEKDITIFPAWINDFSKVFSYPDLSKKIGHKIVNEWKIDVCLYCNDEGIQSRGKKDDFRTDLDHFYPKAKFPFLAISLYNLVPAGGFCNQKFKRDSDMLDCAHPFEEGVGFKPLFHISYPAGGTLTVDNYSVELFPQDNKLDRSLQMFEIAHHYSNDRETQSLLARAFGSIDFLLGLGNKNISQDVLEEFTKTTLAQIIDISLPSHSSRKKKFIVDSVNQFAGKPLFDYT